MKQLNKIYAILGPWVGANISNDISTRLCWISRVQRGTLGHRRLRPIELDGDLGERQLGTCPDMPRGMGMDRHCLLALNDSTAFIIGKNASNCYDQ